jgi:hypothetical protein
LLIDKLYDIILYGNIINFVSQPIYPETEKNPLKRYGEKFLEDLDLKENRK